MMPEEVDDDIEIGSGDWAVLHREEIDSVDIADCVQSVRGTPCAFMLTLNLRGGLTLPVAFTDAEAVAKWFEAMRPKAWSYLCSQESAHALRKAISNLSWMH